MSKEKERGKTFSKFHHFELVCQIVILLFTCHARLWGIFNECGKENGANSFLDDEYSLALCDLIADGVDGTVQDFEASCFVNASCENDKVGRSNKLNLLSICEFRDE